MTKVEAKLFAWHDLYVKLERARSRLKELRATGSTGQHELEVEVSRLQQESDSELQAVNAASQAEQRPAKGNKSPNRFTGAAEWGSPR